MVPLNELKRIAAKQKVALGVVEKDYALTWALYALSGIGFKNDFVFKGGTALRKTYFPDWRYSEDLDFTARRKYSDNELKEVIGKIISYAADNAAVNLSIKSLHSNPEYAQVKLQFLGPMNTKNTIKIDISFSEQIILEPESRKIFSEYSDKGSHALLVYPLEELLAEKIRSILQRAKTRDYYDVWKILKLHNNKIDMSKLHEVLIKKCRNKGIEFKKDRLFSPERIYPAQEYWEKALAHQIDNLPDFKAVIEECKGLFHKFLKA